MSRYPFLLAVGLLTGTIIGAGIFSLPFLFQAAGIGAGIAYLLIGAAVYIFIYTLYADIALRTPGEHRFVGYARLYLGKTAALASVVMTIIEVILVLTIYLILSQSFGRLVFGAGSENFTLLLFWVIGSLSLFWSVKRIAWFEFLITAGMIAIIALIFLFGLPRLPVLTVGDFSANFPWLLLPLAPVLFSLSGRAGILPLLKLIPAKQVVKAITIGTVLSALVYALFSVSVIVLSPVVSEDAVSGLVGSLPAFMMAAIGVFGLFSLISSYTTVGFDVYKSLELDIQASWWLRALVVVLGPILFFLAGLRSFLTLVGFVGGIFLALEGLMIIWMWVSANHISKRPPLLTKKITVAGLVGAGLVFAVALVYEIIK